MKLEELLKAKSRTLLFMENEDFFAFTQDITDISGNKTAFRISDKHIESTGKLKVGIADEDKTTNVALFLSNNGEVVHRTLPESAFYENYVKETRDLLIKPADNNLIVYPDLPQNLKKDRRWEISLSDKIHIKKLTVDEELILPIQSFTSGCEGIYPLYVTADGQVVINNCSDAGGNGSTPGNGGPGQPNPSVYSWFVKVNNDTSEEILNTEVLEFKEGDGITLTWIPDQTIRIAHEDTSSVGLTTIIPNLRVINSLEFDTFGHVTGYGYADTILNSTQLNYQDPTYYLDWNNFINVPDIPDDFVLYEYWTLGVSADNGYVENNIESKEKIIFSTSGDLLLESDGSKIQYSYTHERHIPLTIDLDAAGTEVISTIDFTSNELGHVTSATATKRTLTIEDLDGPYDNYTQWELAANTGSMAVASLQGIEILGGNAITTTILDYTLTIDHNDTSSFSMIPTTGATVIDSITSDTYGHIQSVTTRAITINNLGGPYDNYLNWTLSADSGLNLNIETADILNIVGTGGILTSLSGNTLTIDPTNLITNDYDISIVAADTGIFNANQNDDTIKILGGTGISTSILGDNILISFTGGSVNPTLQNVTDNGNTTTNSIFVLGGNSNQWNTAYSWGDHALAGYELQSNKGIAGGYAPLDSSNYVPAVHMPPLVIVDTFVVASQAAMLALTTAEQGDIAIRTDLNKSFILVDSQYNVLGSWQELLTPTDNVLSVNGLTGAIQLDLSFVSGTLSLTGSPSVNLDAYYDLQQVTDNGNTTTNSVLASNFHLNDVAGWVTFYGNSDARHGVGSRDAGGNATDDIRINSLGSVYINLDSNNNQVSDAGFNIGKHGNDIGVISDWLLQLNGETGVLTLNKYTASDYLHTDVNGVVTQRSWSGVNLTEFANDLDYIKTVVGDSGTFNASGIDTLNVVGSGGISTSVSGDIITISGSVFRQNAFETIVADSGTNPVASNADTLNIVGGVATSTVGDATSDTVTINHLGYVQSVTSGVVVGDNWYRVCELNGGTGRGRVEFIIYSDGGSGRPFTIRGIATTAWFNANSTLTILHSSLSSIGAIRIVRNAVDNRSYLDFRADAGEDGIIFKILPLGEWGYASAVAFTNVTTLPVNDTIETEVDTNKVFAVSQNALITDNEAFSIGGDGWVIQNNSTVKGQLRLLQNNLANFLYTDSAGDVQTGLWSNVTPGQLSNINLQGVTDNGNTTTNTISLQSSAQLTHSAELIIAATTNIRNRANIHTFDNSAGSTEYARFDSSGRLGIGTASPIGKLFIGSNWRTTWGGTALYVGANGTNITSTSDLGITYSISDATVLKPNKVGLTLYNDDTTAGGWSPLLLFSKAESGASDYKATMAGIAAKSPTGTGDGGNWIDGELHFYTAGAATSGIVDRMIIDKDGNVDIGSLAGTGSRVVFADASGVLDTLDTVSTTELGYLDGVTSSIQTQINNITSTSLSIDNNADNRVLTATGGNNINAEASVTWDGSVFTINGIFRATEKSFYIDHPTIDDMKLVHGSLEGPEHAVYHRGEIKNGNVIELPHYWTGLVDEETITVNITPKGSFQKIYVDKIENNKVYLKNGNMFDSKVSCYYTVYGERKDINKLKVEIPKP